ncbi:hypothetical protein LJC44_03630, partial [Parabacteroides sp. OttesenSCG-928-G06]|nr:hypothetical protein [Parabacteroides sp. OttesenSCG-928-G06]
NYVLTDYDYKLHYNLEDYLNKEKEPFNPDDIGLLSHAAISVSRAVNRDELEQLFLSHIPELCEIALTPVENPKYIGVYDIKAMVYASVPPGDYDRVREKIRELFYDNRNLCEDLNAIEVVVATCHVAPQRQADISAFLDDGLSDYPAGVYREIFNHYPARHDLPRIYGVNDWGISKDSSPERHRQAAQLNAYLSLFDGLVEKGLQELKEAPAWFRLDTGLARERGIELKKKLLNNFDKLYGVNSNPGFMLTPEGRNEEEENALTRRVAFLKLVPQWGRDKHKASFRNKGEYYGLEKYIRQLLQLTDQEHIELVEHIFFRHLTEPIRSENYVPPVFHVGLSLTVFVYGNTVRLKDKRFHEGLETLIYQRIPAHLDVTVQWLDRDEAVEFNTKHNAYLERGSEQDAEELKEFIINMRERK